MPRGNRMGPEGRGPRTGRGAGYCGGYEVPGFANPAAGYGYGWGPGRFYRTGFGQGAGGHGWRHWFHATGRPGWARFGYGPFWEEPAVVGREAELEALQQEAEWLKDRLELVQQRLEELGAA